MVGARSAILRMEPGRPYRVTSVKLRRGRIVKNDPFQRAGLKRGVRHLRKVHFLNSSPPPSRLSPVRMSRRIPGSTGRLSPNGLPTNSALPASPLVPSSLKISAGAFRSQLRLVSSMWHVLARRKRRISGEYSHLQKEAWPIVSWAKTRVGVAGNPCSRLSVDV